jgi:acid phosphatase type 7
VRAWYLGGVAALIALVQPAAVGATRLEKGPYLQNVTMSSVTVVWETSAPTPGEVRVPAIGKVVVAEPDELHEVVIDGLEPGRRYLYEVALPDGTIERGEFATAPLPGAPFTFVVFGDSRQNHASHERVVERVRREVPDFILGTGDMVDEGAVDQQWQTFFEVERELLRENVLYPSLGNHDRQGRGRTADNYRRYFSLPENSPDPERYYAFTYSSARFLVLDSNAHSFALTDQTVWIEQQLQAARLDPDIKHIFVSMHHPPYSVSLHGGQAELREAWTPLYEKYDVAAVFSGHDHVYSRAEKNGVHYFVSGGGGAPLYPRRASAAKLDVEAVKYFERVNHFLRA